MKHIALIAAVDSLLNVQPVDRTFVYGDLHCGRPQHVLRERGGWLDGVNVFTEHPAVIASREAAETSKLGVHLKRFDAFLGRQRLAVGATYLGSSGIAFRLLREAGVPFELRLWESDRYIADELIRYFSPWSSHVSIRCENGFDFTATTSTSLVLVDPVDLEIGPTLLVLERMVRGGIPFLCWTPRRSASRGSRGDKPGDPGTQEESAKSRAFADSAVRHGNCVAVQWTAWGATTPGCYLTVSPIISESCLAAVAQLCELLGWACASA